ncbi:hypothetical protein CC86DRAFT_404033 [Ophiobolus disseminans]|uniref:Uncharacterized protein n=1 Tax=Ophiobolus disseminans TaxID=1469910 RepID=A0A6A7A7W8_9PLEO|nr:hypothetical protein CC86DRAFT_404033 [Ophiobolus disseminans]
MAEIAVVVGLIAACSTITVRAATIGKDLYTLISKYKTADKKVLQLSTHVKAVRVVSRLLSTWLEGEAVGSEEVEEVKKDLLEILEACGNLLLELEEHVTGALGEAERVGVKGALQYI